MGMSVRERERESEYYIFIYIGVDRVGFKGFDLRKRESFFLFQRFMVYIELFNKEI